MSVITKTYNNDDIQNIMDKLDSTSRNHSVRVWEIACGIEDYYKHKDNWLSQAAYVHDIGKIYIPNIILDKPTTLTVDEKDIIDRHAYLSYRILTKVGVMEEIARICLYHHGTDKPGYRVVPKWDGDERVFRYAEMLKTIDIYEAITSDRPYHRRKSSIDAIDIISDLKDSQSKEVIDYLSEPDLAGLYL